MLEDKQGNYIWVFRQPVRSLLYNQPATEHALVFNIGVFHCARSKNYFYQGISIYFYWLYDESILNVHKDDSNFK